MDIPGCKMKHIQESGKRITSHVSNLSLLHQHLIEQISSVLLLALRLFLLLPFFTLRLLLAILLLYTLLRLHHRTGDIEPHLDQLIRPRRRLAPSILRAPGRLRLRLVLGRQRELNRDLVLPRQVGVRDLGVGDFERGAILHVETELGLGEVRLTPVPAAEGMFSTFDVDAVPDLEGFAQSLEILETGDRAVRQNLFSGGGERPVGVERTS